ASYLHASLRGAGQGRADDRCAIIARMLGGMLRILVVGLIVLVAVVVMYPRQPAPPGAATLLAEARPLPACGLRRTAGPAPRRAPRSGSTRSEATSAWSTSVSRVARTSARSR